MRLFLLISVLLVGGIYAAMSTSFNDGLILSSSDVLRLEEDSVNGSVEAPRILEKHFLQNGQMDSAIYWLSIGAENGDLQCINNLAVALRYKEDRLSKLRALFWYKRLAASADPELSKNAVKEADQLQRILLNP